MTAGPNATTTTTTTTYYYHHHYYYNSSNVQSDTKKTGNFEKPNKN